MLIHPGANSACVWTSKHVVMKRLSPSLLERIALDKRSDAEEGKELFEMLRPRYG